MLDPHPRIVGAIADRAVDPGQSESAHGSRDLDGPECDDRDACDPHQERGNPVDVGFHADPFARRHSLLEPQAVVDRRDTADAARDRDRLLDVGQRIHDAAQLNAPLEGLDVDLAGLQ